MSLLEIRVEDLPNSALYLVGREGLDQVAINALQLAHQAVGRVAVSRHDHDEWPPCNGPRFLDRVEDFPTGNIRQANIQQDQVRVNLMETFQRCRAVCFPEGQDVHPLKGSLQDLAEFFGVLHNQDTWNVRNRLISLRDR